MPMDGKWFDTWRGRWARLKRAWELGVAGLLLFVGIVLFLVSIPELPSMIWGTLTGNGDVASTLIVSVGAIAVCVLQWRWRTAFYPQLRRDAAAARAEEHPQKPSD